MYNYPTSACPNEPPRVRRPPRSKAGCLTCRRRKVRCNEQKPRCSHCERLNLECNWRPISTAQLPRRWSPSSRQYPGTDAEAHNANGHTPDSSSVEALSSMNEPSAAVDGSFNEVFNYASFMWDVADGSTGPSTRWPGMGYPDGDELRGDLMDTSNSAMLTFRSNDGMTSGLDLMPSSFDDNYGYSNTYDSTMSNDPTCGLSSPLEENMLTEYFIRTVVPPIIAEIETQLKWSSMRQLFISMSKSSRMVHYAILAFSSVLMSRERGIQTINYQQYYDKAKDEVTKKLQSQTSDSMPLLEHILAVLFFLTYIDLLEAKIDNAHANLKDAYSAFQRAEKSQLRIVGKRLISWLRLLDGRAVSAGGDGLFLSDTSNVALVSEDSPTSVPGTDPDAPDADIEDVLFDILYQPGFLFFQRVQSFMGRITMIDPWHRSRGTVADETEVMSIAARIQADLRALWGSRPPLMDYALSGRLTGQHVTPSLAFSITRAFRTYLANYHASKIHLHRVAYKHLPLAEETRQSVRVIQETARVMAGSEDGEGGSKMLPVNMLWALLMWGCEEENKEEREWIRGQICNMEGVATNAKITAQVLQEVQKRQDDGGSRVDVRRVMHDIFDSCFAIV